MGKGHRSRDSSERSEVLPAVTLPQPFGKLDFPLSTTRHTGHMEPNRPARVVWILMLVFLVLWWTGIAWLAIQVTETIILMLRYVVELAQMK